ncbi:P-loop NTPase fold protein [Myxococcus fulvus]|uniref:P-loop NTPase fold protein n=1 Tax=Myxococcus fulvus TaxID=33 RepID=UPI0020BEE8CA|nr:P-loop NTPase fold protein [Myxococcus fulvus]MCK8498616.1 KAP family NTPase [Myxococcus fulvus]
MMREGFDSAVNLRTQDVLGRWRFAQEVLELLSSSPKEWSARVAIYGEWGSGKTSILNFIARMAEERGHVVVWFNPWGMPPSTIWRTFVSAVVAAIPERPLGVDRVWFSS